MYVDIVKDSLCTLSLEVFLTIIYFMTISLQNCMVLLFINTHVPINSTTYSSLKIFLINYFESFNLMI